MNKTFLKTGLCLMVVGSLLTGCHFQMTRGEDRAVQLTMEGEKSRQEGALPIALDKQKEARKYIETDAVSGVVLNNLGLAHLAMGEQTEAIQAFEQALIHHRKVNSPDARVEEGKTLSNLGNVYQTIGQTSKALEALQAAHKILEASNDRTAIGINLINIGALYRKSGDSQKALETYQKALPLVQESNNSIHQTALFNNMGILYEVNLKDTAKALEYYQKALTLAKLSENRYDEANLLMSIADLSLQQSNGSSRALDLYQESLAVLKASGDRSGQVICLGLIAKVFNLQAKPDLAIDHYRQAIALSELIRKELNQSSKEKAASYLASTSALYKQFAELLQQQGRTQEAQAVTQLLNQS
jgi:tetratricopeptide (TPR) repeat protein